MSRGTLLILLTFQALAPPQARAGEDDVPPPAVDLSAVTDRTDLQFDEAPAYYQVLDEVRQTPMGELEAAARALWTERRSANLQFRKQPAAEFPIFVDMIEHPESYRGRAVTLSGHLIRLIKYPAGPNDFDIDTLYEGWLITDDSQQHPTTVVFTALPPGMPIGEELINGVSVTGRFFKLHTYPSRDKKTRFAPLILAQTLSWNPPPAARTGTWANSPAVQYTGLTLLAVAVGVLSWMSARKSRLKREALRRVAQGDSAPDFRNTMTP